MNRHRLVAALACAVVAPTANAGHIAAYAVANHRSCGASNLPATITELRSFFASPHFPEDAAKNFLWTDQRVRAGEWAAGDDNRQSSDTANGFDGPDSGLIAYIASHGSTTNARYTALAGGGAAGCNIRNDAMALGDQSARYLILSTCQGLKIGSGDDPQRPGDNPARTWAAGNAGLNCIFGYSNNMVDSDRYGVNFLQNLATSDATLVQAFFRASRQVSYGNVPAALCFGSDDAGARQSLDTARRFTEDRFGAGGSAWAYERPRRLDAAAVLTKPRVLRVANVAPRAQKAARVAGALLGARAPLAATGATAALAVYKNERGVVTYDALRSELAWYSDKTLPARAIALSDDAVIRIARDRVRAAGVVPNADGLVATHIIDRGSAIGRDAAPEVIAKTVVFHQRAFGLLALSTTGSVEVTVGADGAPTALVATLVDMAQPRIPEWVGLDGFATESHRRIATEHLQRAFPEALVTALDARVGYDMRALKTGKAQAVVEVTLEVEQGGFARRHVERVPL